MGLDFSHTDAHWSYSGFNHFRVRLAAEIGINLYHMEGFGGLAELHGVKNPEQKPWRAVHDDIVPLLNHSDCSGDLTPDECRQVAPRLRELIKNWPDDDRDKIEAEHLARGMDAAAGGDELLEFS